LSILNSTQIDEAPRNCGNVNWGKNTDSLKKGFLMDYQWRRNWYTTQPKSQAKVSEHCQGLIKYARKVPKQKFEPKSKSKHAPLSQHFLAGRWVAGTKAW